MFKVVLRPNTEPVDTESDTEGKEGDRERERDQVNTPGDRNLKNTSQPSGLVRVKNLSDTL